MIKIALLLNLLLINCGLDLPVEKVDEPIKQPEIVKKPVVDKGWLPEYSEFIKQTVQKFPALLELPQAEMKSLCKGWESMKKPERIQLYADLLYAIALPESGYNRFAWYKEPMGPDRVTGHTVRSEGLLQLSYQDPKNYMGYDKRAYEFCPFDYAKDKIAFEVAIAQNKSNAMGERTIQDPYNNLGCGVFIINLLTSKLRPISSDKWDVATSLQGYWSVTRPKNERGYKKFTTTFYNLQPLCKN